MRICRECGADETKAEFKPSANICKSCNSEYMQAYRKRNRDKLSRQVQEWKSHNRARYNESNRNYYATKEGTLKHRARVEKTPRTWLAHLLSRTRARCRKPGAHDPKEGPQRVYDIDLDYLMGLFSSQRGLCIISGLPMSHEFNDLCSISIDRVDSTRGYIPGNVQLVCKWVNLAKQKHSNAEFLSLLDTYYTKRRERDAGLDGVEFRIRKA